MYISIFSLLSFLLVLRLYYDVRSAGYGRMGYGRISYPWLNHVISEGTCELGRDGCMYTCNHFLSSLFSISPFLSYQSFNQISIIPLFFHPSQSGYEPRIRIIIEATFWFVLFTYPPSLWFPSLWLHTLHMWPRKKSRQTLKTKKNTKRGLPTNSSTT